MLATPFAVTAKVIKTMELYDTKKKFIGFLAKAAAVKDGIEISRAEAECLIYEKNWKWKAFNQRFMLRSMAQTRACSKALSNVLRWVVVLAGYEPTPAEEMVPEQHNINMPLPLYKTIKRSVKRSGLTRKEVKYLLKKTFNVKLIGDLDQSQGEIFLSTISEKGR